MASQPSNKNLLVVVGATGNQGSPVARYFATSSDTKAYNVRGITRNVNSEASKQLTELGVEMVQADLNDLPSLQKALSGATHIFANTDSNHPLFEAVKNPSLLSEGQTPASYAYQVELTHGKNIAEAAASTPTLQRIVWSNIASPKKWSNGRLTKVPIWDIKEDIADILAAKPELKEKLSLLFVGIYASMPVMMPQMYAPKKQSDGSYEMSIHMSGDMKFPLADLEVDMGPWVAALFQSEPGTSLAGETESVTWKEWMAKWAKHNGVDAAFKKCSDEELSARMPGFSETIVEVATFLEEYGFTGGIPDVLYPDDLRRKGMDLPNSTIDDHIKRTDWSSIL